LKEKSNEAAISFVQRITGKAVDLDSKAKATPKEQ